MRSRVCVFCGSSTGNDPSYAASARVLGRLLASRGLTLVYGGSHLGLMGELADACLANRGVVIGVVPQLLVNKEVAHRGLTELRVVASMHERKAVMAGLADVFVALPGGYGTLDELCEVLTWNQIGLQHKPTGLLNVNGYYDGLLALLDQAVRSGLLRQEHREMLHSGTDVEALLDEVLQAEVPERSKWADRP